MTCDRAIVVLFFLLIAFQSKAERIVIAYPGNLKPKITLEENGILQGSYVEIINHVCQQLHLTPQFESYPWKRALNLARRGDVDAIIPPFRNLEREEFLYFTETPISTTRNMLYARKDRNLDIRSLNDLSKDMIVGISDGYSYGREFDTSRDQMRLDHSANDEILLTKLMLNSKIKRIDVAVASAGVFNQLGDTFGVKENLQELFQVSKTPSYIAFSKSSKSGKQLRDSFEKVLAQMKADGSLQRILDKYGPVN